MPPYWQPSAPCKCGHKIHTARCSFTCPCYDYEEATATEISEGAQFTHYYGVPRHLVGNKYQAL